MIPRVGKVEKIWPTKSSTDTPRGNPQQDRNFSSYLQEEIASEPTQEVEGPVKKLVLRDRVEISPEARRLYELSKKK
ncbi:MAG: hypothetical protein J6A15_03470 [Clostridia bacterium]|nr:hypothetical protein [Clostridia bacterium]